MAKAAKCCDILRKSEFETISEFIFTMCVGKELYRRGFVLDMRGMSFDRIAMSPDYRSWYNYLIGQGVLYTGADAEYEVVNEPRRFYFNMDMVTKHEGDLFENMEDMYRWSNNWAKNHRYGGGDDNELYNVSKLGVILMHLTAHMVVSMMLGVVPKKQVVLLFEEPINHTSQYYAHIVDCLDTLDWLKEYVRVEVEGGMRRFGEDYDFKLFMERGINSGRAGNWSISDKKEQMKDRGIVEGLVCIWYEREGQAATNPYGRISGAHIVGIDKIGDDYLDLTMIPIYKTKQEVLHEFSQIPVESQKKYVDILNFNVPYLHQKLGLHNVAISDYIGGEDNIIDLIDKRGTVMKRVLVDNSIKELPMSQRDAIFWLLKEYGVDFDENLFRETYSGDSGEFLYDKLIGG